MYECMNVKVAILIKIKKRETSDILDERMS